MQFQLKKLACVLVLFVLVSVGISLLGESREKDEAVRREDIPASVSGRVRQVFDGDTLAVRTVERPYIRIRLYGVDAPEHGQPYGEQAKSALKRIVGGKDVFIKIKNMDQYGRLVGEVFLEKQNVNEELVRNGDVWVYRSFCQEPEKGRWLELEKMARREKKGLWGLSDPEAPWKWRREHREERK